jgi:hypothetical protein
VLVGLGLSQMLALALDGLYLPGRDYAMYMERTRAWLAGDGFYVPHQLAGPYPIAFGDAMYPPVTLVLFVPFTILPVILWWAIPLAITAVSLWRLG